MRDLKWLQGLKIQQLQNLATLTGSPSSGVKSHRIRALTDAISNLKRSGNHDNKSGNLCLVSVDMGIRNLAYSCLTAPVLSPTCSKDNKYTSLYGHPTLQAWRRITIRGNDTAVLPANSSQAAESTNQLTEYAETSSISEKESFEPIDYSSHAYKFVKSIVDLHQPTHIIIERQRFRSGGGHAVQEWTLRVGVFEGMIYAVLRTLSELGQHECSLLPVLPPRVNKYWLSNSPALDKEIKSTDVALKKMKIDIVGQFLENLNSNTKRFDTSVEARTMIEDFLTKWKKDSSKPSTRARSTSKLKKLDDLSDSLLQGLAWIDWQNNLHKLYHTGEESFRNVL